MTNTNTIFLSDSIGDAYHQSPFSDLIGLQVQETTTNYTFRVDFHDLSAGANVNILLDFDGDRQTHSPDELTEASIWSQVAILGIVETRYLQGSQVNSLTSWVSGESLYINLPKSILPIEANNLEVAVNANLDFASEGYDRLANEGYLNLKTGQVHIDNEGLTIPPLSWLNDPANDQPPPVDLKGITMNLVGEHLVIRQYFHHNIDHYSISDVIKGSISLDLDGDILTGFDNVDEIFPTFGIDAEISYFQYPWALGGGFDVNLTYLPYPSAEPITVMLGSPTSDSSYRIGTNWIEISVPLGLLPPITENTVILNDTLTPLGGFDRAPNDSGIKLKDGTLAPFLEWGSPSYQISDPRDDSFAFGYENDDLTLVEASRYQDGILMQINYTDLRTEGEGMTVIDFDINQDDEADISLVFEWNPYAIGVSNDLISTAILIDQVTGEIIQSANPLFTLDFAADCAYINMPNRALGTSATVQAQVKTTDPDYGTLYDETGILTIPNQESANFDLDGDGKYLAAVDGLLFYGYLNIRNLPPVLVNNLTQQLGDNLINPDGNATRTNGAEIAQYLESNPEMMDIDGNGKIEAAVDGLLAYGYLNIRDLPPFLVNNLTQQLAHNLIPDDSSAIRTLGADISDFIEGYIV